jgi:elongation factor G
LEPLPPGSGFEFVNGIKGGVIPGKYIPSVERGIIEAAAKGIIAGYPMVDFRAECYDGSYHTVDSSDIAFQIAGSLAYQKAAGQAGPTLLEPIMEVEVTTPETFMGDVLADITQRRGKVLGMDGGGGRTIVKARVPQAELYKYAASLRAMTQGRAHHQRRLVAYEPVPDQVAKRIVSEIQEKAS